MGHPRIAAISVVLDQDEAPSGIEEAHDVTNDGHVISMEVHRVRHDDPVERRQLQRACEVRTLHVERDLGEPLLHRTLLDPKRARVRIHRMDVSPGPEELRERQRERSFAGAEIGPCASRDHAVPKKRDVVRVTH